MTKRNPIPPGSRPPQSNSNGQASQMHKPNTSNLTYITEDYSSKVIKVPNSIFDGLNSSNKP